MASLSAHTDAISACVKFEGRGGIQWEEFFAFRQDESLVNVCGAIASCRQNIERDIPENSQYFLISIKWVKRHQTVSLSARLAGPVDR